MTTDTRQSLRDQYQALENIINRDDDAPWEFVSGITFVQGALTVLVDAIDADLTVPDALVQRWQDAAAEIIDMYPEETDMPKFKVHVSEGNLITYLVEADSAEQAEREYPNGEEISSDIENAKVVGVELSEEN
jgi:hypothetical protein